jgi:hypothetical protein
MEATSRMARRNYRAKGLHLLCKYYGIDWDGKPEDVFFELAYRLAEDNVPYFQEQKPRSRTWNLTAQARLVLDVWDVREKAKKSPRRFAKVRTVRGACEALYEDGKYKQRGLEQRYKEACQDLVVRYSRKRLGDARWREMMEQLAMGAASIDYDLIKGRPFEYEKVRNISR